MAKRNHFGSVARIRKEQESKRIAEEEHRTKTLAKSMKLWLELGRVKEKTDKLIGPDTTQDKLRRFQEKKEKEVIYFKDGRFYRSED